MSESAQPAGDEVGGPSDQFFMALAEQAGVLPQGQLSREPTPVESEASEDESGDEPEIVGTNTTGNAPFSARGSRADL